jgi:hypothetical protein
MSKMSQLVLDIQQEIERGELSFREIALKYEVPFDWVDSIAIDLVQQTTEYEYDDKPF